MYLGNKKLKPGWIILGSLILVSLIASFSFNNLFSPAGGSDYTLQVKQGDSLNNISQNLEQRKIIRHAKVLRFVMKRNGTAHKIQEGLYDFNGKMNVQEVAHILSRTPRFDTFNVTIPEGKRIKDLPAIFSKAGLDNLSIIDFKKALKNIKLNEHVPKQQKDLEGFVFPATYQFKNDDSMEDIVKSMTNRMNSEFTTQNVNRAKKLNLDIFEWVTLASMVQAEAADESEMPIIAGVFLNRLRDDMTLGSDPTVAYGLGKDLPELNRYEGDFQKDHAYNTYTRQGLPLGPINNPGQAALLSVLNAQYKLADGRDALYFLHAKGKIYVNHTYDEHKRDNNLYR